MTTENIYSCVRGSCLEGIKMNCICKKLHLTTPLLVGIIYHYRFYCNKQHCLVLLMPKQNLYTDFSHKKCVKKTIKVIVGGINL